MRPTIKTIASKAGVSKSTVGRVLNGDYGVSEKTRERVLEIANELEYQPNLVGKALRTNNRSIRLAVVYYHNAFFESVRRGMDAALKEYVDFGLEIYYYDTAKLDYQGQLALLGQLLEEDISGLIIKPADHQKIVDSINEFTKRKIPVITLTSDLAQSNRQCYIGQNVYKAGRIAANLLGIVVGGKGEVAVFQEFEGANAFRYRADGFEAAMQECHPGIRILPRTYIHEKVQDNYNITLKYISETPGLTGIYVTGSSYIEVAQAIKDAGKVGTIHMVCFDMFDKTYDLVQEGVIDFILTQSPYRQGFLSVKHLFNNIFAATPFPSEYVYVPIKILERESIECLN